jgi:uncharacterized membrane protein (Fun14 family)
MLVFLILQCFVLLALTIVCAVLGLYALSWCWYRCLEIGTSSINWAQLSRFLLEVLPLLCSSL